MEQLFPDITLSNYLDYLPQLSYGDSVYASGARHNVIFHICYRDDRYLYVVFYNPFSGYHMVDKHFLNELDFDYDFVYSVK